MSRAIQAADAVADWIIRLMEDVALMRSMWLLIRNARDPSPIARVKLATAQGMIAALRAEEKLRA